MARRRLSVPVLILMAALASAAGAQEPEAAAPSADAALQALLEGNARYVAHRAAHPHADPARRQSLAKSQSPLAIVVCCCDSRVPPELVFDQGLGDLFVIRVAGDVLDDAALGSIEYAIEHLHTHLLVVLGHERCGAVDAALHAQKAHGHIQRLIDALRPAVEEAKARGGDVLDAAVRINIHSVLGQLEASHPIVAEAAKAGQLKLVGARYDLDDGKVELVK